MSRVQRRVLSGISFFPRGGSAHVARALARGLLDHGWAVTLLSGSRSDLGEVGDARAFYSGLDVRAVDFTSALRTSDPLRYTGPPGTAPMQPSFESRPGAPDPVFAALDELDYERQVHAWSVELQRADAASADVLWIHHLTPLNEAAARVVPGLPVIGHLHGTELLMLERIAFGAPASWAYADEWMQRLRDWASACERLLVSPGGVERAEKLLRVERERIVALPNGFDPTCFKRLPLDRAEHWRRYLVKAPRAWRPGRRPGSIRYRPQDIAGLADGPVLLYAGRFTDVKRLPLLIRAYARARPRLVSRAPLVLVGGYPGEWEGEHPIETIEALQLTNVFLTGWHDHHTLARFMSSAHAVILPSVCEQFGQVLIEAMACGLPAIAINAFGPATIVEDGETGWLVAPDDEPALADAIVDAVNRPHERARRGQRAQEMVLARYSWNTIANRLAGVLNEAAEASTHQPGLATFSTEGNRPCRTG